MQANHTHENLTKIAFLFFFVLGISHILSGLMMEKQYFVAITPLLNDILTIPFLMSALIFGFATLYGRFSEQRRPLMVNIFIGLSLVIFAGMILINIFL